MSSNNQVQSFTDNRLGHLDFKFNNLSCKAKKRHELLWIQYNSLDTNVVDVFGKGQT